MTNSSKLTTSTDVIAVASSILESGGYQAIRTGFPKWDTTSTRLFEDKYNVVGIAVFTTSSELLGSWADLQAALVDVISRHVGQSESKAWDGYLVLITTGIAPSTDADIEMLRFDTTRLRKLVATGDDLSTAGDVERLLRPLLPLRLERESIAHNTALALLPQLLAKQGIKEETTKLLVKAFAEQESLMDTLHRARGGK